MNEAEIFAALDAARDGLRRCLEEFDGVPSSDPQVGRSFSDVQRAFALLGDLKTLSERLPDSSHGRLRERLQELLRWNSMVSAALQKDQRKVVAMLQTNQVSLNTMDHLSAGRTKATTLDVSA